MHCDIGSVLFIEPSHYLHRFFIWSVYDKKVKFKEVNAMLCKVFPGENYENIIFYACWCGVRNHSALSTSI